MESFLYSIVEHRYGGTFIVSCIWRLHKYQFLNTRLIFVNLCYQNIVCVCSTCYTRVLNLNPWRDIYAFFKSDFCVFTVFKDFL